MWCFTTLQSKGNSDIYPDIDGGLAVNKSAQKRAIENDWSRLTKRGIVCFEIQALESDRDRIRALARKLTEEGGKAGQLRRAVHQAVAGGSPKGRWHSRGASSLTSGRRRPRSQPPARSGA
jgi:hypothetical protein